MSDLNSAPPSPAPVAGPAAPRSRWRKFWPVAAVVGITLVLFMGLMALKKPPEKKPQVQAGYLVETIQVFPEDVQLQVDSQGVVRAKRQISLVAEVSGKIIEVADNFAPGATFQAGEVLIQIDPADYEVAVQRAQANVANAKAKLELEQAKSEVAKKDWQKYGKKGKPSPLVLNLPQVASAKAALQAAKADLQKALRDLEKTRIKAPFDGIVLLKNADIGQFVTPGANLGSIANSDVAEVRLPLTDEELAMLELNSLLDNPRQPVQFAVELPLPETLPGRQWQGVARRVEAQREQTTLLNFLDVEINDPFSLLEESPAEPLKLNTFLQASIPGKTLHRVFRIDRALLLRGDELNIYKPDNTLEIRPVHVLYRDKRYAYVDRGLKPGERIIITPIVSPYNGMKLRLADAAGEADDTGAKKSADEAASSQAQASGASA
jgi:RND family efflux transporter MFP subunit